MNTQRKKYLLKGLWVLLFQSIDNGLKCSRTDRMLIIYQYVVTYVFSVAVSFTVDLLFCDILAINVVLHVCLD